MQGAGFIGAGGFRRRRGTRAGPAFSVSLSGLSAGIAQDQSTLTYTTSAGSVDAQRWQTSQSGGLWSDVVGATTGSETVDISGGRHGDDALIRVGVLSEGTEVFSSPARLAYAPPVVAQTPVAQTFTEDTGQQILDASSFFVGDALVYEMSPLTGVSIDATLGEITFDTDVMDPQTDTVLNVTASNSGGSAGVSQVVNVQVALDFSVTNVAGEPVITLDGGALTVDVATGPYAGIYMTDYNGVPITVANLNTAPMALVLPDIGGGAGAGDTVSAFPGLWLYAGAKPADPVYQWTRDGSAISNATDQDYDLVEADADTQIQAVEAFGGVAVTSNAIVVPPAASTFVPSDISSLVEDHDAAAVPSTISTNANGVGLWANSLGTLNDFVPLNGGTTPQTGQVTQNGLNTISFGGSQALLDGVGSAFSPSGTILIAFRPNATNNSNDAIYSVYSTGMSFQIDTNSTAGGVFQGRVNSKAHTNLERSTVYGNVWQVLAYRFDIATGVASLWTNGVKDDEVTDYVTPYPTNPGRIVVAANRGNNQYLACDSGQIWRFDAALSDTELANMFGYAQTRWGIS